MGSVTGKSSVLQHAQTWAKTNNTDLRSLTDAQKQQAITEVARQAQVPRAEALDQLMGLWSAQNEVRGDAAQKQLGHDPSRPQVGLGMTAPRNNSLNAQLAARGADAPRLLSPADVDFDDAADVISNAQKFIFPVPAFAGGGEPLVFPRGHEKAGEPITDWRGEPIGDKGLVFHNDKDDSTQAVRGDGQGVVILNQVSEAQAQALMDHLGGRDPNQLSLSELKGTLEFARKDLGIGDMYNSDRSFISRQMNALESQSTGIQAFGLHRRDDRDVCNAVFMEGKGQFRGTATTYKFEDGAVILRQLDAKTKEWSYRLIQPKTFQETYANKDGTPVDLDRLPRG
ncbi:MAG: hypothetical protein ACO3JL_12585 [Myxococcota bacterium]